MEKQINKCRRKGCGKIITTIGYTRSKYPKGSTSFTTSYNTALCQECRKDIADKKPLYVTCTVCKESIFIQQMMGGVRMTCGSVCAKVRHSMLSKERYIKKNPTVTKECPTCSKQFKKQGSKYCSSGCHSNGIRYRKVKRLKESYKKQMVITELNLKWLTKKQYSK